jgi:hypothetical protein
MDGKKYPNSKIILGLTIVFALSIVIQIFFGFGLFAPGTNNYIGYLVGTGGFFIFVLIYAILKHLE